MKKIGLLSITSAGMIGVMASSAAAQTQWIQDALSSQCSVASQELVAQGTRDTIEASVARAEASIRAPASIADLSCMNQLLSADIDVFSGGFSGLANLDVDGLINSVTGGLKSGLSLQTLSSGVERAICDFAAEKFGDLTSGLTGSLDDIVSGVSDLPDFGDGFGLLNIGLSSDAVSTGTTSSSAGSFTAPSGTSATETETDILSIWESISGE